MTGEKNVEKNASVSVGGDMPLKYDAYGIRHLQVAVMCLAIITLFIARSCMAVAVLAMSDVNQLNHTNITIYDWDKRTQGIILSSFFWGYVVMNIPAGLLAKRFGGKPIVTFALLTNCLLSALLPTLAALGGWMCVCFARGVMGFSQSCLYPATQTLLGQWLPPSERTTYAGIVYGGVQIGTIIAMPVSGILAETALGWKLIFYAMSGLLAVTTVLWCWLSGSSPAEHRMISKKEREYIEKALNSTPAKKSMNLPWKQIVTCVPLYAILASHIGMIAGFALFFADMPTYLEKGLKISLKNSAVLSALPYIGMWVGNTGSTFIAGKLLNKNITSVNASRKIFNSIGMFGVAAGLILLSFLGPENKVGAIIALIITLTLSGFTSAGFLVNGLDLSPNFAGVTLSITNCIANFGSILMPIMTSYILNNDPSDVSRWRIVFLIVAAISVGTNIIYLFLTTTDTQEWNDPDYMDKKKSDPEELIALAEKDKETNKSQT